MHFTLYYLNYKNKQTISGKDKSQDKFKTSYIHELKTPIHPAYSLLINVMLI